MNPSAKRHHIRSLDGLRGVAILMVFLYHTIFFSLTDVHGTDSLRKVTELGTLGVDLFFCLSGFLITGILYAAKGHSHYFRNFYARRSLRIFPLYYFFLLIYFLLVVKLHLVRFSTGDHAMESVRDLHWLWFYGANILIAHLGHFIEPVLNHFWTLSVEEHFYFAWPLLVYFLDRRRLSFVTGLMVVGCLAFRAALQAHGTPADVIRSFTLCRVDSFAMGGSMSLALEIPRWRVRVARSLPWILGLSAPFVLLTYYIWQSLFMTIGITATSVFFTSVIAHVVVYEEGIVGSALQSSTLRFMGKYSYALYVFHWPIQIAVSRKLPLKVLAAHTHSVALAVIVTMAMVALLSVIAALTTWNMFEKRFLALKRFFPEPELVGLDQPAPLQIAHID